MEDRPNRMLLTGGDVPRPHMIDTRHRIYERKHLGPDGANRTGFTALKAKQRLLRSARNDNPLPGIMTDCHCDERIDEAISSTKNARPPDLSHGPLSMPIYGDY